MKRQITEEMMESSNTLVQNERERIAELIEQARNIAIQTDTPQVLDVSGLRFAVHPDSVMPLTRAASAWLKEREVNG